MEEEDIAEESSEGHPSEIKMEDGMSFRERRRVKKAQKKFDLAKRKNQKEEDKTRVKNGVFPKDIYFVILSILSKGLNLTLDLSF